MSEDNISRQADEIEAISSIYDSKFVIENESNRSYSIKVEECGREAILFFKFPEEYPTQSPPIFQISAPWLKGLQRIEACGELENVFLENIGEPVIYQWVEKLREFLLTFQGTEPTEAKEDISAESPKDVSSVTANYPLIHGEPLQAGKCTFQGHLAKVKTIHDVKAALVTLKEIKKVANATHNMYAFRIKNETGNITSDCDDDGETHAGSRMLHLLEILNVSDVLVVVSRWFGGVHLGPARFQHINNAARQVLTQSQIICTDDKKGSK